MLTMVFGIVSFVVVFVVVNADFAFGMSFLPFSNLNRWPRPLGLFCQGSRERDLRDWEWMLRSDGTPNAIGCATTQNATGSTSSANAMKSTITHCNRLQHVAANCKYNRLHNKCKCNAILSSTQQHTATYGSILQHTSVASKCNATDFIATDCNRLQHMAAHCNTRLLHLNAMQQTPQQHSATHCNTWQRTATHVCCI